jgi:hypothetical protein
MLRVGATGTEGERGVKTYVTKINILEILFQIFDIEFNLKMILVEILLEAALTEKTHRINYRGNR